MSQHVHPLIMNELSKIAGASIPTPYHTWVCDIHVNGKAYRMPMVLEVAVDRDFIENVSDVFKVSVKCDLAVYNTVIYPNRHQLKVSLVRKPNYIKGSGNAFDALYQVEQYIAKLTGVASGTMVGENPFATSMTQTNQHSLTDIQLQLISPVVARLRNMYYGTNHRNTSAIDVIRTALTLYSNDPGDRSSESIIGVDVADNHSTEVREQIRVPHDLPYIDLPAFVDRHSDSVYPTGFSYYLQRKHWYIYSPYDTKRHERGQYSKSLTIINVPSYQLPGIEKTYRDTGTQVIIIANGQTKQFDQTERASTNIGTGSRFVDANAAVDDSDTYKAGKIDFNPDKIINEFSTQTREDDEMNRLSTTVGITGNPRREYGRMAMNNGSLVGVVWDLSAPDILYPGMPVKYIYIENGLPVQVHGVLNGVNSKDSPANKTPSDVIYTTTSYLSLFLERA